MNPTKADQPKRKRGAQPGNQNAKGNRGNPNPRRNFGNKGGTGAKPGNQYARKKPKPKAVILLKEYRLEPEATAWIEANADKLNDACFTDDDQRDAALYYSSAYGVTPETIAERGLEMHYGLFDTPEFEWERAA